MHLHNDPFQSHTGEMYVTKQQWHGHSPLHGKPGWCWDGRFSLVCTRSFCPCTSGDNFGGTFYMTSFLWIPLRLKCPLLLMFGSYKGPRCSPPAFVLKCNEEMKGHRRLGKGKKLKWRNKPEQACPHHKIKSFLDTI